jgi:hypothetical protein
MKKLFSRRTNNRMSNIVNMETLTIAYLEIINTIVMSGLKIKMI